jgi:hypothetical protein
MPRYSAQAKKIAADLQAELAKVAAAKGKPQVWSAAESALIDQIQAAVTRKNKLERDYQRAEDPKVAVKLAGEVRLLESHIQRMLRAVTPKAPTATTLRSAKARTAANVRWSRGAS